MKQFHIKDEKSAREMFEELGYELDYNNGNEIVYNYKDNDYDYIKITSEGVVDSRKSNFIRNDLIKAVAQQLKEAKNGNKSTN